jgi:hypothetical protein
MKKISKKIYKYVSYFDPISMGAGSGLGVKIKKMYYVCDCGKIVAPSQWKKHVCKTS